MANQLTMDAVFAILALRKSGVSIRGIARQMGIHRETVGRYIRLAEARSRPGREAPVGSKVYQDAPLGSVASSEVQPAGGGGFIALPPTAVGDSVEGAVAEDRALLGSNPSAAAEPYGTGGILRDAACLVDGASRGGQASQCEPLRSTILDLWQRGLSAQRIYQDIVGEHGFTGSYYSVRRFVSKLGGQEPLAFRRMECEAGAEAQVDFGSGAMVSEGSSRRRPHVLRVVLSHSRKGYSEVVFRQRTEDFLACLENAFWHFGGVPRTVVIDNLKAAVKRADWFDPQLHPRILAFCEHYGTAILPTRPYTPRHKGKVERGVGYVQDNALKGRTFESLQAQNLHLQQWESTVADTRIHGTMRQQVCKVFEDAERRALLPLPAGRFPFFHESQRTVHRDGHVEVDKAYYSVPPEYLGRPVCVRWDGRMVRIFNQRMEQIALHAQREPGKFSTQDSHIVSQKISAVERGTDWLMRKVSLIGEQSQKWAAAMLLERGVAGVRVLVGLSSLAGRHDRADIERACEVALAHGAFHLRALRELIKRGGGEQAQVEFLQEHPIIRDLSSYGHIVRAALRGEPVESVPS